MNSYDLFRELSEVDEDLIMEPRRFVSLRLNFLFCIIAANLSALAPKGKPGLGIVIFLVSFAVMYVTATWLMNRRKKRKLLSEGDGEAER